MKRAAPLVLAVVVAGCTFPSVEYDTSAAPCSVPDACKVAKCVDDANKVHDMCLHSMNCEQDPPCKKNCDDALDGALEECKHDCQTCAAAEGCTNPSASCAALVGQ